MNRTKRLRVTFMLYRLWIGSLVACIVGLVAVGCGPTEPCSSVTCPTGQTCQNGLCITTCPTGQTACGATCHDTKTDNKHCGGCNLLCRTGEECKAGTCTLQCTDGKVGCSGQCVDTQTNKIHCGACGTACKSGEVCKAGKCEVFCSGGTSLCGESCVDIGTNTKHCGACNNACKQGETCSGGQCVSPCGAGQTDCSGTCANLQTSANHCGSCGTTCKAREVCNAGKCELQCPQGQTLCTDKCYDLQSNLNHCGACDNACKQGQACSNSSCTLSCPKDQTDCSGSCADLQTSSAHCGSCDNACSAGQACIQGKCALLCKEKETNCSGACVDPQSNDKHCGFCGNACATGSGCCGGTCLDLQSDSKNCGACGTVCPGVKICKSGSCACPQGQTDCGGTCFNTQTENKHCGACNNACKSNEACSKGVCTVAWALQGSGYSFSSSETGYTIKFDGQGNRYILAGFRARIDVGTLVATSPQTGILIAKFNNQNNPVWVRTLPLQDSPGLRAMDVDAKGNVYLTGTFRTASLTFGTFTIKNPPTQPNGSTYINQVYAAKIDTNGNWLWATGGGSGSNNEDALGVVGDTIGNTYVVGSILNTSNQSVFGTTTLSSKGSYDIFVGKLNTQGVWQWVELGGGTASDRGFSIGVDSKNNIYVAGHFNKEASFGLTTLTSQGDDDIFVGKLSPAGAWIWVNRGGGKFQERLDNMVVKNDTLYLTGKFQSESLFGSLALTGKGGFDIFVAQVSSNGLFQWAASAGGKSSEYPAAIDADSSGNVYITGNYSTNSAATSFSTFGTIKLKSKGTQSFYRDIFVAKLNKTGSWQWARSYGGTLSDEGWGIALNSSGSPFVIGSFNDKATFGSTTLTSKGYKDIFIAKLSNVGAVQQVTAYPGQTTSSGYSYNMARDNSGNTYIVGSFTDKLELGSITLTAKGAANDIDVFVAKINAAGKVVWAKQGGTLDSEDYGYGVDVDSSGNVYITGNISGRKVSSFGSISFTSKTSAMFVAKLNSSGVWQWVRANTPPTFYTLRSNIKVNSNGTLVVAGTTSKGSFGNRPFNTQGGYSVYVVKYNASGQLQWLATNSGKPTSYIYDVSIDSSGNIYVAGSSPTETFGSLSFTSKGNRDAFVAKLNSGGAWQWVKNLGGNGLDAAEAITTDAQGNVFVAGYFTGSMTVGINTYTSKGARDVFLGKLNSSGQWQWVSAGGGTGNDITQAIDLDSQGNIYIGGYTSGAATFGSLSVPATGGPRALYLVKADSQGTWSWLQSSLTGDANLPELRGLRVGSNDEIYVTGHFTGNLTLLKKSLTSLGKTNIFLGMILP